MPKSPTDILLGAAIGDALGVPYEFSSREEIRKNPCRDMVGYGTHNQPPGTWSDDSSLTFCLAEAMIEGYSLESAARNFVRWKNDSFWTAHGSLFDIGMTTREAITQLDIILQRKQPEQLVELRQNASEMDNGNGSLMRIAPFLLEILNLPIAEQFERVWLNSALTHKHIRAAMSCMIYLKLMEHLWHNSTPDLAYAQTRQETEALWKEISFPEHEQIHFSRIIQNDIRNYESGTIKSGGYVIESLEAALFSFLTTGSFEEAVLKAINFGHDTDTTGAITGGLAGLFYGQSGMPAFWIASLARMEDIFDLGGRLEGGYP